MRELMMVGLVAAVAAGCDPECSRKDSPRTAALADSAWQCSQWLSVKDSPVITEKSRDGLKAAPSTSWFMTKIANACEVKSAKWMTAGLGVYELYLNDKPVGSDFLKPGFTDNRKTKYSFTYDVTKLINRGKGESNVLKAEVSAGWWRDKVCTKHGNLGFFGKKSAFRGVLELTFADGTTKTYGTNTRDWRCCLGGPVQRAAIFDGEIYDARVTPPRICTHITQEPEVNTEFKGKIFPSAGAEICFRRDIAIKPIEIYTWKGIEGASKDVFGKVKKIREFKDGELITVNPGETLVVDFGQNAAAVPCFAFRAEEGTIVTALPGEMLNEANGERKRGNDGPAGSIYRQNLRWADGMWIEYTFGKGGCREGFSCYHPRFSFFGYRYISVTATAKLEIARVRSVPVTSISKQMEIGKIKTGCADVNKLISNVYWGQLSNYVSVPTDCPQRNERLGWTADTQVFSEAGTFNANTKQFFHKWMRDMRDNQHEKGGFPGVAPFAQYGNEAMRVAWADAGVIVPFTVWKQFGDKSIIDENWAAMEKFVARVAETKYQTKLLPECGNYQWADWLSYEKLESCGGGAFETDAKGGRRPKADALAYWDYLGGCYWIWDAQMMASMAKATGRCDAAAKYEKMAAEAKAYMKGRFFATPDGMILNTYRDMQTPALFALKFGLVEGAAKAKTIEELKQNFKQHGDCLQTGFPGTSIIMDTLTENGMADIAYTLLLQHKNPSWLYSVDQGATTIWERWNSYVKATGFGPVGMNSFNHYAYGAVLAWIYKTAAGIAADVENPGFANIVMKPVPDKRLGSVAAEYKTPHGLVKSAWHYENDGNWVWEFTVPQGATASVTLPGEGVSKQYSAGEYRIVKSGK